MWFFGRKRVSIKDTLIDSTDYHSHILYGVDDGAKNLEVSLEILRSYEEFGVKSVWLTPHIMEDIPNSTSRLKERFTELKEAYSGSVQLFLASENMLDNLFEERLENNDLLPLGEKGDHLLVETSYFNPPMGFYNTLERVKSNGYYPVLAHPERYMYLEEDDYKALKDSGIKFQLNVTSLIGAYGREVRKKAQWLKKQSMYDFAGTDIHNRHTFKKLIKK